MAKVRNFDILQSLKIVLWVLLAIAGLFGFIAFYRFLSSQMPADPKTGGFWYHYQSLISVLVAVFAVGVPYIDGLRNRRKAERLVRLKAHMLAQQLYQVLSFTWPSEKITFDFGASTIKEDWERQFRMLPTPEITIDDARDLQPADIELVRRVVQNFHMTEELIKKYEFKIHHFDFNEFSIIPHVLLSTISYASALSGDKDFIKKASAVQIEHKERIARYIHEESKRPTRQSHTVTKRRINVDKAIQPVAPPDSKK